jgi:hypothetical protein
MSARIPVAALDAEAMVDHCHKTNTAQDYKEKEKGRGRRGSLGNKGSVARKCSSAARRNSLQRGVSAGMFLANGESGRSVAFSAFIDISIHATALSTSPIQA